MPELAWFDLANQRLIPAQTVLENGKTVALQGSGYGRRLPKTFVLNRVPSKIVRWALVRANKPATFEALKPGAFPNPLRQAPQTVIESPPVGLASAGVFHTHRWQFSAGSHRSPIIRTCRMGSASFKGAVTVPPSPHPPVASIGIEGTVQMAVDPHIRIEPVFPWPSSSDWSLRTLITDELLSLPSPSITHEVGTATQTPSELHEDVLLPSPAPTMSPREALPVLKVIEDYIQLEQSIGVEYEFERFEGFLDAGETAAFRMTLHVPTYSPPFAFAFAIIDTTTSSLIGSSEVALLMAGNIYFTEG